MAAEKISRSRSLTGAFFVPVMRIPPFLGIPSPGKAPPFPEDLRGCFQLSIN